MTRTQVFLGERLLRLGPVLIMIVVLLIMRLKPRDFYLAVGNPRAVAQRDPVLRLPPKPEPWTVFGRNYALISTAILLAFLDLRVSSVAGRPDTRD